MACGWIEGTTHHLSKAFAHCELSEIEKKKDSYNAAENNFDEISLGLWKNNNWWEAIISDTLPRRAENFGHIPPPKYVT